MDSPPSIASDNEDEQKTFDLHAGVEVCLFVYEAQFNCEFVFNISTFTQITIKHETDDEPTIQEPLSVVDGNSVNIESVGKVDRGKFWLSDKEVDATIYCIDRNIATRFVAANLQKCGLIIRLIVRSLASAIATERTSRFNTNTKKCRLKWYNAQFNRKSSSASSKISCRSSKMSSVKRLFLRQSNASFFRPCFSFITSCQLQTLFLCLERFNGRNRLPQTKAA